MLTPREDSWHRGACAINTFSVHLLFAYLLNEKPEEAARKLLLRHGIKPWGQCRSIDRHTPLEGTANARHPGNLLDLGPHQSVDPGSGAPIGSTHDVNLDLQSLNAGVSFGF
jgi:hypothetical protein